MEAFCKHKDYYIHSVIIWLSFGSELFSLEQLEYLGPESVSDFLSFTHLVCAHWLFLGQGFWRYNGDYSVILFISFQLDYFKVMAVSVFSILCVLVRAVAEHRSPNMNARSVRTRKKTQRPFRHSRTRTQHQDARTQQPNTNARTPNTERRTRARPNTEN